MEEPGGSSFNFHFPNVHQLIVKLTQSLVTWDPNESVHDNCNDVSTTHDSEPDMSSVLPPVEVEISNRNSNEDELVEHADKLLRTAKGKLYCSECHFGTTDREFFSKHCLQKHRNVLRRIKQALETNAGATSNTALLGTLFCCKLCNFVSLSLKGFKTHSTVTHKHPEYASIFTTQPTTNPDAKNVYLAFLDSLPKTGTAYSNGLKKFKRYFNHSTEGVRTRKNDVPSRLHNDIPCMKCSFITAYPSKLDVHYREFHKAVEPLRSKTTGVFYCEVCGFSYESYKKLHVHFSIEHGKQSTSDNHVDHNNGCDHMDASISNASIKAPTHFQNGVRFKCHKCSHTCEKFHSLLEHWDSYHDKDYPKPVEDFLEKTYDANIVKISYPAVHLSPSWTNGWVNEACTDIINFPKFTCGHCEFECSQFKVIDNHYTQKHSNINERSRLFTVAEDKAVAEALETKSKILSQHNYLFHCQICSAYSTCFVQCMYAHYTSCHGDDSTVSGKSFHAIANHVLSSVLFRCLFCEERHPTVAEHLEHVGLTHAMLLVNFTTNTRVNDYKQGHAEHNCLTCDINFEDFSSLEIHLADHQADKVKDNAHKFTLLFCCSRCRKACRSEKFLRHHYSRNHQSALELNPFADAEVFRNYTMRTTVDESVTHNGIDEADSDELVSINPSITNATQSHKINSTVEETLNGRTSNSMIEHRSNLVVQARTRMLLRENVSDDNTDAVGNSDSTPQKKKRKYCKRNLKCPQCTFKTSKSEILDSHMLKHQINNKSTKSFPENVVQTCSHAGKDKSSECFENHISSEHNTIQPYKCPHCPLKFICKVVRCMHMRKKHGSLPQDVSDDESYQGAQLITSYDCSHEDISKTKPNLYSMHCNAKHAPASLFQCSYCPTQYVCENMFTLHLKQKHDCSNQTATDMTIRLKQNTPHISSFSDQSRALRPRSPCKLNHNIEDAGTLSTSQKDYNNPESVRNRRWKCVSCDHISSVFTDLRTHAIEAHDIMLVRCPWCDFIAKEITTIQSHLQVHQKFMENQRKNSQNSEEDRINEEEQSSAALTLPPVAESQSDEAESAAVSNTSNMEYDEVIDVTGRNPPAPRGHARKRTLRPDTYAVERLSPAKPTPTDIHDCYIVYNDGSIVCKFCRLLTTDCSRMLVHMKAVHAMTSRFNCRHCFESFECFDDVRTHVVDVHKLIRNHHLAIGMEVDYASNSTSSSSRAPSGKGGRWGRNGQHQPQPITGVHVVTQADQASHSNESAVSSRSSSPADATVAIFDRRQTRSGLATTAPSDPFRCKYCGARSFQTMHELEQHMRLHEIGLVDHSDAFNQYDYFSRLLR